jgi:hypothetical protein
MPRRDAAESSKLASGVVSAEDGAVEPSDMGGTPTLRGEVELALVVAVSLDMVWYGYEYGCGKCS